MQGTNVKLLNFRFFKLKKKPTNLDIYFKRFRQKKSYLDLDIQIYS